MMTEWQRARDKVAYEAVQYMETLCKLDAPPRAEMIPLATAVLALINATDKIANDIAARMKEAQPDA